MIRVAKTVVAKSVLKRSQSTRKLERKMNGRQHPASKTAVASLSASVTSPEVAQTADASQAGGSTEAEVAGLRESLHQLVYPLLKTGALHRRVFVWAVPHGHAPVPPSQPPERLYLGWQQLRSARHQQVQAAGQRASSGS